MVQVNRNFMGAVLSRPASNFAPLAPMGQVQRVTPSPNQATQDMAFRKRLADQADIGFNKWYAGQQPDSLTQFDPDPAHNTLSINGVDAATDRNPNEISAVRRQNARDHYMTNLVNTDADYVKLRQERYAVQNPQAGAGMAPLAPGVRQTTTGYDANGNKVTTVQGSLAAAPKHDLYDYLHLAGQGVAGVVDRGLKANEQLTKAGTEKARLDETALNHRTMEGIAQENADTAAGRAAAATQPSANAQLGAQMKAIDAENRSILQRLSQGGSGASTVKLSPEEQKSLYERFNANVTKMMQLGGGSQTGPAPQGGPSTRPAASGSTALPGSPATSTQPYSAGAATKPAYTDIVVNPTTGHRMGKNPQTGKWEEI